MALIRIPPSGLDRKIAAAIEANTNATAERVAEALTWMADERLMCAAAAVWWFACRNRNDVLRQDSTHILVCTIVASILPHVLKTLIDQERPDRKTIVGHWRGMPFSGKRYDAFPSRHS